MKNKETRTLVQEMRANEEQDYVVEGTPIVFNQFTDIGGYFRETIIPEALKNCDLKDVRFLVNHDTNQAPLARSRNNNANSTMQLKVKEDGLHMKAKLDHENPRAVELYSAIKRGDIDGMSFMFFVDGEEWSDLDTDYPTRTITSIQTILEVSAVTFPAYEGTSIGCRDKEALDSAKATLDSVRASREAEKKVEEERKALQERKDKCLERLKSLKD